VVLATAAATLWLLVALQQFWVRQIMGGRPLFSFKSLFDTRPTMRNFSSSVPFWINSVANIVCPTADIVIVSMLIGPETAAYYYAASRTALLLDFFISTFSIPAAPRIARLYETGHRAQITRMTSSAACLSAAAAMIVLVALWFFGNLILRAFGDSFVRAHGILMLLAAGQVANAYLGIGTPALEMTGHQDQAMRITVFTALFELIALMIATYEFGMWGAAVAAILSILIRKVAIASHIYMTDGIDITGASTILEQLAALRGRLSWAAPVI
jgi:O-antigen/teichoic acid export membrane protein